VFHREDAVGADMTQIKPKDNRKPMSWAEYDKRMHEIIIKHDNVADSLIEMITFSSGIKLEPLPQSIFIPRNIGRKLKPVIITRGKRGK
jgi:hypothetical protein